MTAQGALSARGPGPQGVLTAVDAVIIDSLSVRPVVSPVRRHEFR